jgi:hypothetical protein
LDVELVERQSGLGNAGSTSVRQGPAWLGRSVVAGHKNIGLATFSFRDFREMNKR